MGGAQEASLEPQLIYTENKRAETFSHCGVRP